jgi:HD superfamily phosphohydrolase
LEEETRLLASKSGVPDIGKPHEYLTYRLLQTSYMREVVDRFNERASKAATPFTIDLELICNLVSGLRGKISSDDIFLLDIIHGESDADRIDYLLRDGHYTGATHGEVDKERLFETFCVVRRGSRLYLGIREKGLESIEGLYASRDLMYSTVYLHHTARIAEATLLRAMAKALPDHEKRAQLLGETDETCLHILDEHRDTKQTLARLKYRRFLKRCDVLGLRNLKSKDWSLESLKPGSSDYPSKTRGSITEKLKLLCGTLQKLEQAISFEQELMWSAKVGSPNDITVIVDCPRFELPTVPDIESGKEGYLYPVLLSSGKDVPLIHVSSLVYSILMYEKTFRPKLIVATNESSKSEVRSAFRALFNSRFSLEVCED